MALFSLTLQMDWPPCGPPSFLLHPPVLPTFFLGISGHLRSSREHACFPYIEPDCRFGFGGFVSMPFYFFISIAGDLRVLFFPLRKSQVFSPYSFVVGLSPTMNGPTTDLLRCSRIFPTRPSPVKIWELFFYPPFDLLPPRAGDRYPRSPPPFRAEGSSSRHFFNPMEKTPPCLLDNASGRLFAFA